MITEWKRFLGLKSFLKKEQMYFFGPRPRLKLQKSGERFFAASEAGAFI